MSDLMIHDLTLDQELDREAAAAIRGGVNDWIFTARPASMGTPGSGVYVSNTYIDNDFFMIQPQIFNVGNGVNNTGTILYNIEPQSVSAASPVNILGI